MLALPNIRNFFAFHWIFGLDRQFSSVIILIFAPQYGVQNQVLRLVCALRIAAQGDAKHTFDIVHDDRGAGCIGRRTSNPWDGFTLDLGLLLPLIVRAF